MPADSSLVAKIGLKQRTNAVLLVLNVAGALLYIWLSSFSWVIPAEEGLHSLTGEPFIWAMAVLPVLAIALVINLSWGVMILRRRAWSGARLWALVAVIWLLAIAIDFANH
jgi:hypothetical protein